MGKIIVDDKIRFGKPIIAGTRISVEEVIGALAGGMTINEIEKEYGITEKDIKAALKYAAAIISEERIGLIKK